MEIMDQGRTLNELLIGDEGRITGLTAAGAMRSRLTSMGFLRGNSVRCLFASALGDPRAYGLMGAVIALRREDAATVRVAVTGGEL